MKRNQAIEDIYKLSPMQEGMLFHSLMAKGDDVYFIHLTCTLHGPLHMEAFERAWQEVIDRYAVLRTAFHWEDLDKPLQVVYRKVKLSPEHLDWRGMSAAEQKERLGSLLKDDQARGFNLSDPPLMRITLIRLGAESYQFVWSFHHLLMDGWSKSLILQESFSLYEAFSQGGELKLERPRPYSAYIGWLQQQDMLRARQFWQESLKGFTAPTPLVIDSAREGLADEGAAYGERKMWLPEELTLRLHSLARRHELTLSTLMQGAWGLLLSRYSGEQDVVFGVTVSGRPADLPGVESMVGVFINTLPMRVQVPAEEPLIDWLKSLQAQQVEIGQYEYSPLLQVQKWADVPPGQPLFESTLAFENYPVQASLKGSGGILQVRDVRLIEKNNYALTLLVNPGPELLLWVIFDEKRFSPVVMEGLLGHMRSLLEAMAADPRQRLSNIDLLSEVERQQLFLEWNDTRVEHADLSLVEMFENQVGRLPDSVAAVLEGVHVTYDCLDDQAGRLADYLRENGVGPEVLVGVCLQRSHRMLIGLLAVLKAGGAYVPLDPAYPKERLSYMVGDARLPVLLTEQQLLDRLPEYGGKLINLDSYLGPLARKDSKGPSGEAKADNLCYVMYTSGSTGRPKGVALGQGALVNLINWQVESLGPSKRARTLQFAPFSFDVSFQEILSTLCSGGTLILVSEETRLDTVSLWHLLRYESIERLFLPFVALQQLSDVGESQASIPTSLREVITSGAQLRITPQISDFFTRLDVAPLHNQYGPSETHAVTVFILEGSPGGWPALPPIGRPIANSLIYILDNNLLPVPTGVAGEIYIGGSAPARGYLGRADMTAEKFIPDPFTREHGKRMYKAGDLARYAMDGKIEFLGRVDHQVKIRGFRIEPGEVEAILSKHPGVRQTAVVACDGADLTKRLVAYVVPDQNQPPGLADLREYMKALLPEYMIPSAFVFIDEMPQTPNGKIDRRRLSPPDQSRPGPEEDYVAPRTAAEQVVAAVWAEFLGVERLGVQDNFFELGGQSLMAVHLVNRLRKIFGVELPIQSLFEAPTVEGVIERIAALWGSPDIVEEIALTLQELDKLSPDETGDILSGQKAFEGGRAL